jgi:hypothetical protein
MTRLNSVLTMPSHCLVYCVGLLYDVDIKHRIKSYTSKSLTRNQVKDWLLQKKVNTFCLRSDIFYGGKNVDCGVLGSDAI